MHDNPDNPVPEYLVDTYEMLKCAFPETIPPEDYFALMAILSEQAGFRSVAKVMSFVTDYSYAKLYNDALRVESTDRPNADDVERVKQSLIPCGYQLWLDSD